LELRRYIIVPEVRTNEFFNDASYNSSLGGQVSFRCRCRNHLPSLMRPSHFWSYLS